MAIDILKRKSDRYSEKKVVKIISGIGLKRGKENWVSRKIFARNIMKALKGVLSRIYFKIVKIQ